MRLKISKFKTLKERIEDKVYYCTSGCWIWTGYVSWHGRPLLTMMLDGKKKIVTAARVSWRAFNGEIPEGLLVCHHCDNPMCVNPHHLFLGTHMDNYQDMVKKGRARKPINGSSGIGASPEWMEKIRTHKTKLNPMFVTIIREGYSLGYNMADMARYFKVTHSTIKDSAYRRHWKNI